MPRILVLYHSTYGHVEAMAEAVAEGARSVEGAVVDIRRVPELVPEELAKKSGYKLDQAAPVATVDELGDYDAIIVGAGTRYGTAASQMRNFLDQTGGLWARGALVGKVGSAFTSTATQHGGQETTLIGLIQTCCTTACSSPACRTHGPARAVSTRSPAARPMARPPSRAETARAGPARTSSKAPAGKAAMSPRRRPD